MTGADLLDKDGSEVDKLIFWRSLDSISTMLDDEIVILDINSDRYSGLNEVGTVVWSLLENHVTFADMLERILTEFEVTTEVCSENLLSFLKELAYKNLIEVKIAANT